MRIQIVSDIHSEMHMDAGRSFIDWIRTDADVLVIAGDAGTAGTLENFLPWACAEWGHVVYVVGNHEYYGSNRPLIHRILKRLRKRCKNFHWLRHGQVTIEGQRFVGTPLWFRDDVLNVAHEGLLNDFRQIEDFRGWVYKENERALEYLANEVREGDVVVTHHIPTYQAVTARWVGSPLNRFFVCDVGDIIERTRPKLWCYGHTHESNRLRLGETELVCNPFGYVRYEENPKFNPRLVIEV